jgi:hypothetical protein
VVIGHSFSGNKKARRRGGLSVVGLADRSVGRVHQPRHRAAARDIARHQVTESVVEEWMVVIAPFLAAIVRQVNPRQFN